MEMAELVDAQYRRYAAGVVDATLKPLETAALNEARRNRSYNLIFAGNAGSAPEPDVWLRQLVRSDGSRNYANYEDPKLDADIDRQHRIFNVEERKAAIRDIIIYTIDRVPAAMPVGRNQLWAVKPTVHGFKGDYYMTGSQYENVWFDA
jgi:ABC-type oligopeptide transport system substrate-binding subunit